MTGARLRLAVLPGTYAVRRLPAGAEVPQQVGATDGLMSVTATRAETSIVCPEGSLGWVPSDSRVESGWRTLEVAGPLDFGLTGVLASLAAPLADAEVPIFALSTYDTDYLLVRAVQLDTAISALRSAGHEVSFVPVR